MIRKAAYGVTAALAAGVVIVELLHAPTLIIFALTSLALVGLAWVLGQATESLGHHAGPHVGGILNASFGDALLRAVGRSGRGIGVDRFWHTGAGF